MNNIKIKDAKSQLTASITTDTNEKSFSFWKDENGVYQVSSTADGGITNGGGNSTQMTITNPHTEGVAHTHITGDYNCFSNGDIFNFQKGNAARPSLIYSFAFASDGSAYMLTIVDQAKFKTFIDNHPITNYFTVNSQGYAISAGFKEGTDLYNEFKSAMEQFLSQGFSEDDAFAGATAHVLIKYDTGAALSQQDSNGNFNSIFVNESISPSSTVQSVPIKTYTRTSECNFQ